MIYTKIENATRSLYGNDLGLPTENDVKVKYTKNNHAYEISEQDIKKYKEFVTDKGVIYARNGEGLENTQVNVWVKKAGENTYVLAIGKEFKWNVGFAFAETASLTKLTYNDTAKTEITVSGNKAEVYDGEVVLTFAHGTGATVKLYVDGVETAFTDNAGACTATINITKDTEIEVK